MEFEWDDSKAAANLAKHGVNFEYAARAFFDPRGLELPDNRLDYGEKRSILLAMIHGRVHVVVYTLRGTTIRIISARKANRDEQARYDEH